ncbi:MAG: hypothetical protein F6K19_20335 [Cyanothece sp. SIO1E1]|nr:hypothetical protein [Cyanothece sp. SIO1E1]
MASPTDDRDFQIQFLQRLDKIDADIEKLNNKLDTNTDRLGTDIEKLDNKLDTNIDRLSTDIEKLDDKFDIYRQGTEGMVRMATTIIIAAGTVVVLGGVLDKADILFEGFARLLGR